MIRIIRSKIGTNAGYTTMIIVAIIASVLAFNSLGSWNSATTFKSSVSNTFETNKAELLAIDGAAQIEAYVKTQRQATTNMAGFYGNFLQTPAATCKDGLPHNTLPVTFRPYISAAQSAKGEEIVVYASISDGANPCLPPDPQGLSWTVSYRAVGRYNCGGADSSTQKKAFCAEREIAGSIGPNRVPPITIDNTKPGQICEEVVIPGGTSGTTSSFTYAANCQGDAYEFKILNLRAAGSYSTRDSYGGSIGLNPSQINNFNKLWHAPVTVVGNVVNGNDPALVQFAGFETSLGVSFGDNLLYMGINMPPMPNYTPVQIGGNVVNMGPGAVAGAKLGITLNVFGAAIDAGSGRINTSAIEPTPANYTDPLNPQAPLTTIDLAGASWGLNDANISGLTNADTILKFYTGLDKQDVKNLTNAAVGVQTLNDLTSIETTLQQASTLFRGLSGDKGDWYKMGVTVFYAEPTLRPQESVSWQEGGAIKNKSMYVDEGTGTYVPNLGLTPTNAAPLPTETTDISLRVLTSPPTTTSEVCTGVVEGRSGETSSQSSATPPYTTTTSWIETSITNRDTATNTCTVQRSNYQTTTQTTPTPDYHERLTNYKLVGNPSKVNTTTYNTNLGKHWIRDYWNNPKNSGGGCFGNNQRPCRSPYTGAESITDNTIIVIDGNVSWKYLRGPAAQLIIILGDLVAEDVQLNSNIIVMGNLILKGRGMTVAPRRWWGVPRDKRCDSPLALGTHDETPTQTSTGIRQHGTFYLFNGGAVQVTSCTSIRDTGGTVTTAPITTTVCEPTTELLPPTTIPVAGGEFQTSRKWQEFDKN